MRPAWIEMRSGWAAFLRDKLLTSGSTAGRVNGNSGFAYPRSHQFHWRADSAFPIMIVRCWTTALDPPRGFSELQQPERLNGARSPYACSRIAACPRPRRIRPQNDWPRSLLAVTLRWRSYAESDHRVDNRAVAVSRCVRPQAVLRHRDLLTYVRIRRSSPNHFASCRRARPA